MEYRLYGLDAGGRIVSSKDLIAADDLAALREAEAVSDKSAVEVWQGTRRVARVNLGNAPLGTSDRMSL